MAKKLKLQWSGCETNKYKTEKKTSLHHSFRDNQARESVLISRLNQQKFCHLVWWKQDLHISLLSEQQIQIHMLSFAFQTVQHKFTISSLCNYTNGTTCTLKKCQIQDTASASDARLQIFMFYRTSYLLILSKICPIKYQAYYVTGNKAGYNMKALMISSVLVPFYVLWQLLQSYHIQWLSHVTTYIHRNEASTTKFMCLSKFRCELSLFFPVNTHSHLLPVNQSVVSWPILKKHIFLKVWSHHCVTQAQQWFQCRTDRSCARSFLIIFFKVDGETSSSYVLFRCKH